MAADLAKALDRARSKLEKNDDEAGLEVLLTVWRAKRVPRIADVIDRVSERITEARGGAITAKTVALRTKKWIALARKKNSLDVGPLLATPWPGTWNHALPVLDALVKLVPLDPRVSMALARLVDETPFDTYTSRTFYRPLLAHLSKLLDARTLPILEADLDREKSYYWNRGTRPLVAATVAKLKTAYANGPPKLSSAEEASLAAVEALFASSVMVEKAKARGESDFLKAIYESPDDDGLRAVFADWLTERGDPRGEFIALQLAHQDRAKKSTTHEIEKREASLLKKHGKAWAGPLDRLIKKEHRVFERGFLASAILELESRPRTPPKAMSDPAWATLHTLEVTWDVNYVEGLAFAIFTLPSLRWLRAIRGLREAAVMALIKEEQPPRPRVEEIDFMLSNDWKTEDTPILATGVVQAFPNLKRLTVETELQQIEGLLIGGGGSRPLGQQLERITMCDSEYRLGPLCRLVERLGLPAKEVGAVSSYRRNSGTYWRLTATRDERNRFTRIYGEPEQGSTTLPSASDLDEMLEGLKPEDLTELTVDKTTPCKYDEGDIQRIEKRLEAFPNTTKIDVPWERLKPKAKSSANEMPIVLSLAGDGVGSKENLPTLWKLLGEPPLSLSFDSYAVNYGAHTALPDDGLAHAITLLEKKRTSNLRLYRKGSSDAYALVLRGDSAEITAPFRLDLVDGLQPSHPGLLTSFVDDYIAWLARLHDAMKIDSATVVFIGPDEDGNPSELHDQEQLEPLPIMFQWIIVLGPEHAKKLAFDDLEKLAGSPGLEWLRAVRTKRNLIFVSGPRIDRIPTDEQRVAFQMGIASVLWDGYSRTHGFVPSDLVIEVLGPALAKHGFKPVDLDPVRQAQGEVFFVARNPSGACGFAVETMLPMNDMFYRFRLSQAQGKPDADLRVEDDDDDARRAWWIEDRVANTEKKARAALKGVAGQLEKKVLPWFITSTEEWRKRKKR